MDFLSAYLPTLLLALVGFYAQPALNAFSALSLRACPTSPALCGASSPSISRLPMLYIADIPSGSEDEADSRFRAAEPCGELNHNDVGKKPPAGTGGSQSGIPKVQGESACTSVVKICNDVTIDDISLDPKAPAGLDSAPDKTPVQSHIEKVEACWWLAAEQLDFGWGLTNEKRREYTVVSPARHTPGHVDCEACAQLKANIMQETRWREMPFRDVAPQWLESRKRYISPRTYHDYAQYTKTLTAHFGELLLQDIHIGHVREFQIERTEHAGNTRTNHELSAFAQIMKRAGEWKRLETHYEPLPLPKPKTGKAISPEDEDKLFLVASKRPRWRVAYCASSLTANTTAGPGEIRHLRVGDVDLDKRLLYIREGTKNEFRIRKIPLNSVALKQAGRLMDRYRDIIAKHGIAESPEHFLLPHRAAMAGDPPDFDRPMYSWNTAWVALRKAAGMPTLRMYDLRHLAITKLLENPNVSEETTRSIAGHVSRRMFETYSHVRQKARQEAVDALEPKTPQRQELALVQKVGKS